VALIKGYRDRLASNRGRIREAARRLEGLAARRVVIWGAGRIFDVLVQHGRLDVRCLAGVVDTYLAAHVSQRHGCPVLEPRALPALEPGLVLVASRAYRHEIEDALRALVPGCEVLGLEELLSGAGARSGRGTGRGAVPGFREAPRRMARGGRPGAAGRGAGGDA
jgi:hypothetical protein